MKKALIITVLLAVIGLVASLYLIPRTPEIALINFKDKRFDEARAAYEQQLKEGSLKPEVVNTLVDLYLQVGAIDQAISVMEQYIAKHPDNIEARNRLGQLYQFAQRPDDYLRNLEEINRLQPTPETLQALSQIYNFKGDYDKQVETLKALITTDQTSPSERYVDLANLQASRQARADAIATLLAMKEKHPNAFTFQQIELLVSLLLDEKRAEEAYTQAVAWKDASATTQEVARLVNLLHYKGAPEFAGKLLDSYDTAAIDSDPNLLQEKVLLLMDSGQEAEAYARLLALYKTNKLSPELKNRLLFMAIARNDNATADELIRTLDFNALSEPQALAILELSMSRKEVGLQKRLNEVFNTEESAQNYPLLTTMLTVASQRSDAREKLAGLEQRELSAQQNLQVARICARVRNYTCTSTFLSRLPDPAALSDADVAGVGDLYLELRAYDKGLEFLKAAAEGRNSPVIEQVRIKYAAVRGEENVVFAWLEGNGKNASARTLSDLYYIARNNRQLKLASLLGERLYAMEQSTTHRSMLASAYTASGQYAKAVTLLRGARGLSQEDENNYLLALTKLARTSPEYRGELAAYAGAQLRANISYNRKMALIYALINARQIDVAMPHIRELALKNGGQWAAFYAGELDKQGKYDEARSFWKTLAAQPSTSLEQKRQIAYNFLARGYRMDAEPIFEELAMRSPAESEEVRTLLYLWGPRLNADQLDWLAERFNNSPDHERGVWAQYIAQYASAEEIIPFAEQRHPETLFAPVVLEAYLSALAKTGELKEKDLALLRGISEHGDPELIRIFAQTARQNDYKRSARAGYETLFQQNTTDNDALRNAGLVAFSQADYSASREYLTEYLRSDAPDRDNPTDAVAAEFTYGELMRRERMLEEARPYYLHVAQTIDAAGVTDSDSLSKKAQALIWAGEVDAGLQTYEQALAMYPNDDVLRADWIAMLIELKRYDEARTALAEPLARAGSQAEAAQPMPIPTGTLDSYNMYANGSEVLLRFAGSDDDVRQFASNAETLPWVSYTSEGYRQLLIAAKPGYAMTLDRAEDGSLLLAANPAPTDEARRQIHLRYELLAARTDLETGSIYAATQRINTLLPEYPQDAQLIGFAANAENYGGNWHRAQALLSTARQISPENEDVALLDRDLRRVYAPNIKLDHEWVFRDRDDEHITTLSGHANMNENLQLGFVAQNDNVKAENRRRDDGRIGDFKTNRQRYQLYGRYFWENGNVATLSLYGNNKKLGAGLAYAFLNPLGESGLNVEYRRPYWEFIEGVLDSATRDRVSVWHMIKPSPRWVLRAEPGLNRYSTDDAVNTLRTWSIDAQITYLLVEPQPYITIGYGLAAEYGFNSPRRIDGTGTSYRPLPFRSREVHFVSLNTGYQFDDQTYGELLLGYGVDRLGGNGPMIEGRLTHEFTDEFDAQIRAGYGIDTEESDNSIGRLGGYLRYRF